MHAAIWVTDMYKILVMNNINILLLHMHAWSIAKLHDQLQNLEIKIKYMQLVWMHNMIDKEYFAPWKS